MTDLSRSLDDAIPDTDGLYGRGYRDALQSIALALEQAGVAQGLIKDAQDTAAEAYGNQADQAESPYEIQQTMNLSTAHLSDEERVALDQLSPFHEVPGLGVSMTSDFGWLLYLDPDELVLPLPPAWPGVSAAVRLAISVGATFVRFDADGPVVSGLPTYEWDT